MNCEEVREFLGDFGESGMTRLTVVRDHLDACADCRRELANFEELQGALESLAARTLDPPSWLEGSITETISQKAARIAAMRTVGRQVRRPQVVTGGALVAAGIAGALLFRSKRRQRARWTGSLRHALAQTF